ncbi:MAG: response regulator transcription factor [Pseudomonadota bacterium]
MILVIYSDNQFQQIITQSLSKHGFLHDVVSNYQAALSLLDAQHYSLVIVQSHAQQFCLDRIERLVLQNPDSWIMAVDGQQLTNVSADEADYFEVGVDDYLGGAFNERVFVARIRSHMRRSMPSLDTSLQKNADNSIQAGPFKVDLRYHSVTLNGQALSLTAREFTLINYLCRHPNQVFSRNQLLSDVWGYNHEGYEHTVNTHINRLRNKLDNVASIDNGAQLVETVWGVGYKLNLTGYVDKALSA